MFVCVAATQKVSN